MMFHVHGTLALQLIALVFGVALLILIKNQNKIKSYWLNFVAWFVIVLSSITIICSAYYAISFWKNGYFEMHRSMMMMMRENMMEKKQDMMKKENQDSSQMMK